MKLLELFQHRSDYTVEYSSEEKFRASATIGGRKIIFWGQKKKGAKNAGLWEIDFVEELPGGGATTYATGSGSAPKVFAFVIQMMRELVKEHPSIEGFYFISSGRSRTDLYSALLKRYLPAEFELDTERHSSSDGTFAIRRKK